MDSLKFKVWSGPVKLFPVDAICFVANILIRVCSLFVRSLVLVGKKSRINARLVSFDSALSVFVRSFVPNSQQEFKRYRWRRCEQKVEL